MRRFNIFPGIIFVLLGMNVLIVGVTVYAANMNGGAAIEPDYYQKALAWDDLREQERRSLALGWDVATRLDAGGMIVELREQDRPIAGATVEAVAFPSAAATRRSTLTLRESEPGVYRAAMLDAMPGLWRVELLVNSRGRVFTQRRDVTLERMP